MASIFLKKRHDTWFEYDDDDDISDGGSWGASSWQQASLLPRSQTSVYDLGSTYDLRPVEPSTAYYMFVLFVVVSSFDHLLVMVVCWQERKTAVYKRDIIYMVGLAAVDLLFCSIVPVGMEIQVIYSSMGFTYVALLLTMISVTLLTLRAIERFRIVLVHMTEHWSLKCQIYGCMFVNISMAMSFICVLYYTEFPIVLVYVCVCALIILVAYIAITGKVFIQNYKLKTRVNPLRSSQQDKASRSRHTTGGSKGDMELKVVSEEGTTGPTTNGIRP